MKSFLFEVALETLMALLVLVLLVAPVIAVLSIVAHHVTAIVPVLRYEDLARWGLNGAVVAFVAQAVRGRRL